MKDLIFLPAPMEGVMRQAVIESCNELDLTDSWYTPFLRVTQSVPKMRDFKAFLAPFAPEKKRVIMQLMGNAPELMAQSALRALEAGAAGVDLNCGCPSRQVTAHHCGAGALREWDVTPRVVEAIRNAVGEAYFSVKMRLGFYSPVEAAAWLPKLESAGAPDAFILHFRTAVEGYLPTPGRELRLQAARNCVRHARVIGNGDIAAAGEAVELCRNCDLDGAMIGRGFWRDPWILRRLRFPDDTHPSLTEARQNLWALLADRTYDRNGWCRGAAIELASLILGGDSPEARKLKYSS